MLHFDWTSGRFGGIPFPVSSLLVAVDIPSIMVKGES